MYIEGRLGHLTLRKIRYYEDVMDDKRNNYHLGFAANILPVVKVTNNYGSFSIVFSLLLWECVYWKMKYIRIDYDLDGMQRITRKGFRYYLFLKFLFEE